MWDLPNIKRMNEEAAKAAKQRKRRKKFDPCKGKTCLYCKEQATHADEFFDIFSDDPKGFIFTCDQHYEDYGGAHEGYFVCDSCGRTHVENYTWESYVIVLDDEILCLRCAFEKYVKNEDHWLREVPPDGMGLDALKEIPHLIAVDSDYWRDHLTFIGNAEFDAMDGHQISGDDLTEMVEKTLAEHGSCIVLLDAAYQFAVSFGVYVRKEA